MCKPILCLFSDTCTNGLACFYRLVVMKNIQWRRSFRVVYCLTCVRRVASRHEETIVISRGVNKNHFRAVFQKTICICLNYEKLFVM